MLRPQLCQWFELLASRDDLAAVLEALADTGAVELQGQARQAAALRFASEEHTPVHGLEAGLAQFHELAKRFHAHWPVQPPAGASRISDPAATLAARLAQLQAWGHQAEPVIVELERVGAQWNALADLRRLLAADPGLLPAPGLLAAAGSFLVDARIYAVTAPGLASELPAGLLQLKLAAQTENGGEDFVVLVGPRDQMAQVDAHFASRKARRIPWPADLQGNATQAALDVQARASALAQRRSELAGRLNALAQEHDLSGARADIALIEWLVQHGGELAASERLVWITGWTAAADEQALSGPLERLGLRCVVQFVAPPTGTEPPSRLTNPAGVRAFEAFGAMLGQPGRNEVDPSPLVALIAPLLFGFMFGDVGQGAVLCAAGWLLRKRAPMLVLLVPGGLMAMLFGLLFGTVFAREDLIPALWLHPLDEPVTVLAVAVGLGALILLGGLVLNALQAFWRHAGRRWWACDAGLLLAYAGLLGAVARPELLWLVPAGALWMALGSAWQADGARLAALGQGLAQFAEQALQLAVNTVSFARVGAFALAHAGLSVAVVGVAEASGAIGYWIVMLIGNLLIVALEGLVVSIQTTRLLLFEFFLRFLKSGGRALRPLPPPLRPPFVQPLP